MERLIHSWSLLTDKVHPCLVIPFFLVSLVSIRRSTVARLNLLFSGFVLLIWSLYFGYSTRNMSVALPLLSLSFASGLEELLRIFKRKLDRPELSSAVLVSTRVTTVLGTVGVVVLFFLLSGRSIEDEQSDQIDARGDHVLNAFLVDHFENEECNQCVLTNYRYLEANPKLRRIYFPQYRVVMTREDRPLWNMENFQKWLESKRIRYVLFSRKRLRPGAADFLSLLLRWVAMSHVVVRQIVNSVSPALSPGNTTDRLGFGSKMRMTRTGERQAGHWPGREAHAGYQDRDARPACLDLSSWKKSSVAASDGPC